MKSASRPRTYIFELQPLEIRRFLTTASISSGTLNILGTANSETIAVNKSSTTGRVNINGVSTTFDPAAFTKINISAVGGNDTISISLSVPYVSAIITGGSGNDMITGGGKADLIRGDGGFDTANYSARTSGVKVTLDLTANDGGSGGAEGDNVQTEEVIGGSGADSMTGSTNIADEFFGGGGGGDTLTGNAGNDELVGSTGIDRLLGGQGDDALYARNSDADTVNGGTGPNATDLDLAEVDSIDVSSFSALMAARTAALLAAAETDPTGLDPSYGGNDTGLNSGPDLDWDAITAATFDSQRRAIIVGYDFRPNGVGYGNDYDFVAVRYTADGEYDQDFGEVIIDFSADGSGYGDDDFAYGVTTDADDNIIIVGTSQVVVGESLQNDFAIARISNTGAPSVDDFKRRYDVVLDDSQTGSGGDDVAVDVVVQADDKIVVVGTHADGETDNLTVMRLDSPGDLDANFNNGLGMNTLDLVSGSAVALQSLAGDNGAQRIVVGGNSGGDFAVARFTAAGLLDTSFAGGDGEVFQSVFANSDDVLNDIVVNPINNDILAVGQSVDFGIILLSALSPVPQSGAVGVLASFTSAGAFADVETHAVEELDLSFNAAVYDPSTGGFVVVGATGQTPFEGPPLPVDFVVGKFANINEFAADWSGLVFTDFTPEGEEGSWLDAALGVAVTSTGKPVVAGYSDTGGGVQGSVARYGDGGETEVIDIEQTISYDDVQNDTGANRSAAATFYIKSTHLDEQGGALIDLTNINDVVLITLSENEDGEEQVAVDVNGLVLYYDLDTTSITINGKNGNDVITASSDIPVTLRIFGGNGNDLITGGSNNDLLHGGAGNDTVTGNDGHDVLVGEAGLDSMSGNDGNDILIGGSASDNLNGGGDEDILIGGTTAYDNNPDALASISAEWSSGESRGDRINTVRNGGVLNGSNVLKIGAGATVFDDNARDTFAGGGGDDWFFRKNTGSSNTRDLLVDLTAGEEVDTY